MFAGSDLDPVIAGSVPDPRISGSDPVFNIFIPAFHNGSDPEQILVSKFKSSIFSPY